MRFLSIGYISTITSYYLSVVVLPGAIDKEPVIHFSFTRLNSIHHTVLVPGAAAPAGINTIKSLKMANFSGKVIGTDSDTLAAGAFLADLFSVMPEAKEESLFSDKLFELVKTHRITVLMPSSGFDIYQYSKYRKELLEFGAYAVVSDIAALKDCQDKMRTFEKLSPRFKVPFTTTESDKIPSLPIIAKPRFGKGSKDIMMIKNESDLRFVTSKYHDMIFQQYLPGTEYTVDVLSDLNKEALFAVPRIRLQTKGGISTKGKIVCDDRIEEDCMNIAKTLGIRGPCCIQMKETEDGEPQLVEVNARLGGGTIFTTLAGANIPALILDLVNGKKISIPKITEITVIRYFEEIVVYDHLERQSAPEPITHTG
jgi:carbamoyl-phosphate synthase large subunit